MAFKLLSRLVFFSRCLTLLHPIGKSKRRKRKKTTHKNEEDGDAGKESDSMTASNNQSQYFYLPNSAGSLTLMKIIGPGGPNQTVAGQPQAAAASDSKSDSKLRNANKGIRADYKSW